MRRVLLLLLLCCFVAPSCGGKRHAVRPFPKSRAGKFYVVKPGDTIWKIARRWDVAVQAIAEWNNIQDPDKITPGRKLYLPGGGKPRAKGAPAAANGQEPIRLYHGKFLWPVKGTIHSPFGIRNGRRHDGVDIGAPAGTPIRAAAAGEVAYNDTLSGYGHLLILRHPDQFYTAYAHNARNVVKVGERVKQGQVIAHVGSSGRASGPHCHFEIRHGQNARNPLFFLPNDSGAPPPHPRNHAGLTPAKPDARPQAREQKSGREVAQRKAKALETDQRSRRKHGAVHTHRRRARGRH